MASEIREKASSMSTATLEEASGLLRKLAGARRADETIKGVFRRLGRKLDDWSDSRIRDVWYRDPRVRIRGDEVDRLRDLANQNEGKKAAPDELAILRDRVARLERLLDAAPSLPGPAAVEAGQWIGKVGGTARALD